MIWKTLTLALAAVTAAACSSGGRDNPQAAAWTAAPSEWFVERARETGLDFVHFNGMTGEYYYPEIMAPGVGLLDYDNDGDLDVYVVQGQLLGPDKTMAQAVFTPQGELRDRLFRNDLTVAADGTRSLRFTDVTAASGIDLRSYGMGLAAADFDNDGWVDIYRTGLDRAHLLRNNGDGTFVDVTPRAGVDNRGGWGVSAAFVDYDRDGWLDLYVGNYLIYTLAGDIDCLSVTGRADYCPPNSYRAQPDRLYRNRGDGTFTDVTARALTGGADGPALGVSTADFDGDGWLDIYVGNDGEANQLWMNQRDGTFKDMAFVSGAAVNGAGNAEASMGIDAGDFDNDGDEDLFVTNWQAQMNILYLNVGGGAFEDRKAASGLGSPSLAKTGFGAAWFDFDNDSWLDLITVNGAIQASEARRNDPAPYAERKLLFRNLGNGRFGDVTKQAGSVFQIEETSRGAAFGDVDNDGDVDVLVGNLNGPARLLVNNIGSRNHWIGLKVTGGAGGRDMLGARIEIIRNGRPTLWRRARADGSYASANDPRVIAGLGDSADAVKIRVRWPSGGVQEWSGVPVDRWTTLKEGRSAR